MHNNGIVISDVIRAIGEAPLFGIVGALLILAIVLAPAALAFAGLTGSQIVDLLKSTMQFFVSLIHEFRASNADKR